MNTKEREPYTAQGGWNLVKPDGSVLMFQGGFERDTILKLLNEAHALGAASKTSLGGELGWIPVGERLPEVGQLVALVNINRYWNTGTDVPCNIYDAGMLSEFGTKYWSVRGERGSDLNAYTHWMPLPEAPTEP